MFKTGGNMKSKIKPLRRIFVFLIAAFVCFELFRVGEVIWYGFNPVTTSAYIESETERLG